MMHRADSMHRRAFSLVEILIVVAMLGILAAIVAPRLGNAQDQTNESRVKADLQTVRHQIQLYRFKHKRYPADVTDLVPDHIPSIPLHPAGGTYVYDAGNGTYTSDLYPGF